ncbi:Acyl transferase domain-containing protein [Actinokineospora alba]|uniref:type I polyketide synthase n=1 Tax=Actinokineospora alba TaxID=504798 RepID=UPI00088F2BD9|nr:type I polyketide synthase [Actinokineospora alba]SDI79248.1 Acyl transferase domain-containing protein [Actinokineospora alba]
MPARVERPDLVIGITASGAADAALCAAVSGAGGLGVLDLGSGDRAAREALASVVRVAEDAPIGVRVPHSCALTVEDFLALLGDRSTRIAAVVLGWDSPWSLAEIPDHFFVLVEATSAAEALRAAENGADGVILRGSEAGGRVGSLGSFVLLQQVLNDPDLTVPVWVCGGIGPNTAAGAVVAGAAGVVLETQLSLLPEAELPAHARAALATGDASATVLVGGHRVLPDRTAEPLAADLDESTVATRVAAGELVAAGQDVFLAQRFARSHGSVARAVRAVLTAVRSALAPGVAGLAEGSALARALGTALPVAQGPMTRVSDQAAFAAAVAGHGALPFVALALSTEDQTRALLTETRETLGERPWGVGVLGFAPEGIRAAQLAVIKEMRPATALIAGGRPDQARALEDEGIATFLHVPSTGLLSQFLAAGARRFVFEGAECGGHVGPLSSFALWEAQVAVLIEAVDAGLRADELHLLFAGGIHDARSAATVAAVADPLVRKGAGVGVLMGTGYLFTEEAVTCGAVQPVFQRQVLAATHTELLRTAPGHATRCVSSPFTESFHSLGRELLDQGVPEREVWERLESLNTGRLRIASKGVRREGDELVAVDEDDQLDQGLFMAGDVAVLRSQPTTIAALHAEVTSGAVALWNKRSTVLRSYMDMPAETPELPPLDIAIVGMSAMFPGADTLAAFWSTVVGGADQVTEVPQGRWDVDTYYAAGGGPGRTPSKWGGFLPEIPFDPLSYGIPPSTLAAIEPVQLLALEAARRALADAGYPDGGPGRDRTSVVFGAEAGSDLATAQTLRMALPEYLGAVPEQLADQLPELSEDTFPGRLANVISGRIANRLDLGGANYTVDAACASSLAAVDIGCKELVGGTSDMVLCGGADLHNAVDDYLLFSSVGALSKTGRCATFDSSADGIALGEGVAVVVLKRLADAERDGDRVYAVIRGVGSGSDGKALGLTAPRPDGQRRAIERAYRTARVSPTEIGLVEAHGTGTVVGDRTELSTLDAVFTEAGAEPGSCVIGSVKSQIGHTKCAAGLAGLIKAALAVHTGVKPPTLHVSEPNPAWDPRTSPFVFHGQAAPWTERPDHRVAGVSAFGFGGTNFHVVLRGHQRSDALRHGLREWPAELLVFRGADAATARRQAERLLTLVTTNDAHGRPWTLRDLARTAAERADRDRSPVRIAVVAKDLDELATQLRAAIAGQSAPGLHVEGGPSGKLGVLFPGQGSQRPGMLADLFVAFPELGRLARAVGMDTGVIFPPSAFDADSTAAQADALRDTRVAQPALGLTGLAVHHLLTRLGVTADAFGGHSYGELVALAAAGALDAGTLMGLSTARAEAILGAAGDDPGTMAAVSASRADTAAVLDKLSGTVVIANDNGPRQVVVSGPTAEVEEALEALRAAGLSAQRIPVACAFHSPLVAGAGETFAEVLAGVPVSTPEVTVWSNRTASAYPTDPDGVRAELAAQIGSPVRFADQIEAMYADGVRIFLEAGAGRVLSGLVGRILGDRPHTVITCDGGGLPGLLDAVARLAVAGSDVRTGWLFSGRDAKDVSTLTPPARPGWTIDGSFVRTVDGSYVGLAPARKVTLAGPAVAVPAASDRDEMVSDFLRTSRELIAAQRDVLLGYLGSAPVAQPVTQQTVRPVARPAVAPVAAPVAARPAVVAPDALSVVVEVIAARTGYPVEMIDPAVDLEADLSVDSIKRTEIAGEVASRLGLTGQNAIDALVKTRTAAAMAQAAGGPENVAASMPQAVDALTVVIEVIAGRTGYPVEMIDPAVDLEADLSVDSIKRTEIAGEVAARLGLGQDQVDVLVKTRTAAAMAEAAGGTKPVVASVPQAVDALAVVVEVIAARTGYPVEMISPTVDLEADLSVDSIKRTEIAGEVAARLGLGQDQVDVLVKARTAAAMAQATGTESALVAPVTETEPGVMAKDSAAGPLAVVIDVIAARTGYPPEMISPTIDLEADLSIDSIKRTEIAGEVAARLGLGQDQVEVLVKARTAAAMAGSVADKASPLGVAGSPAQRYVLELVAAAAEPTDDMLALAGKHILIAGGDPALATELADQLSARGALAIPFQGRPELAADVDRVDGLISLHALHDEDAVLPGTFGLLKSALARGPKWVIAASAATPVAAGLRGLFRSLHREYPELVARHVELDAAMSHEQTAELIVTEVLTGRDEPAVIVTAEGRRAYRMVPKALGSLATSGAGPAGTGAAEAQAVGLGRDSVVLLIGGARGITAQVAVAIGEAAGCHIELAGRTVLDAEPEPPAVLVARDLAGLRSALAGLGGRDLAQIEREAREILARREVIATLREIRGTGATAEYHTLDVRDGDAVRQLIKQVHTEHGRLDGVVYAAGVIEDRLVADKDPKSFERVYGTKVGGASAVLGELSDLAVATKFVVFFGSIAAALGNRGQADYAAANDALESMAAEWSLRTGNRALTVHWGPWAPVGAHSGMVSAELGRSYAERGIKLLDPNDGVASLLRELAWGDPDQNAVVYSASEW